MNGHPVEVPVLETFGAAEVLSGDYCKTFTILMRYFWCSGICVLSQRRENVQTVKLGDALGYTSKFCRIEHPMVYFKCE